MRGKWAAGIPPRNFTWIVKDQLAVSERPGGSAPNHRRVRRQEEIIWLRVQGFSRVVSLLPSPHNLAAYDEGGVSSSHFPLVAGADAVDALRELYSELDQRLHGGERLLVHQEELGDRVMGVAAGYLLWSGRLPGAPQAIAVVERLIGHAMGPRGRDLVAEVAAMVHQGPAGRPPSARPTAPTPAPLATIEAAAGEGTPTPPVTTEGAPGDTAPEGAPDDTAPEGAPGEPAASDGTPGEPAVAEGERAEPAAAEPAPGEGPSAGGAPPQAAASKEGAPGGAVPTGSLANAAPPLPVEQAAPSVGGVQDPEVARGAGEA